MVKSSTKKKLVQAGRFHIKIRLIWTRQRPGLRRRDKCEVRALADVFQQSIDASDAPYLRSTVGKIRHKQEGVVIFIISQSLHWNLIAILSLIFHITFTCDDNELISRPEI